MEYRKWLEEGYCPVDKYHCLMPIEYEGEEVGGVVRQYHKKRMACRHALAGKCDQTSECEFWKQAPEKMDKNALWYEE